MNEKIAAAAEERVRTTFGLSKEAFMSAVGSTLANAGSRALASGTKAFQFGKGNMAQNALAGLQAGGKAFNRAGGTAAAGKALGATAAVGAGLYGAGRAVGAGVRDANAQ